MTAPFFPHKKFAFSFPEDWEVKERARLNEELEDKLYSFKERVTTRTVSKSSYIDHLISVMRSKRNKEEEE
jgi:hypothetical protein